MPEDNDNQITFSFDEDPVKKPMGLQKPLIIKTEIIEIPIAPKKSTKGRKSLKAMVASADLIDIPPDEILFQKLYYTIGNVAEMFKVNQSLLRFWENEFDILKPKKNRKGDRMFRPEDIKNLQLIHHLIREKKYTLEGAKDFLKNNKKSDEKFAAIESLKKMKAFLLELKANL
jgi:DNA-binding transcriptional MerR regulator